MSPLERDLSRIVPEDVLGICRRLRDAGFRAWLVGGCVRDELLHTMRPNATAAHPARGDWDLATSARPEQVQKLFRKVIPTGIEHGTVTVMVRGMGVEVTTLRGETSYSDGRRPDTVFYVDDITADLARRDFTINAIAYDPLDGALVDPFDGIGDLRRNLLRAVGDAKTRFAEDGLRALRAARFVATLEVDIDPATAAAIEPSLSSYRRVSPERVRDEWLKLMKAPAPSRAFEIMRAHGLLAVTAPELLEQVGCDQGRDQEFDVWQHTMLCVDHCPKSPVLRMAGLLHDLGKPRARVHEPETNRVTFDGHAALGARMADDLLQRLRFSNQERTTITALIEHHVIDDERSWTDADVRRFLQRVSPALLPDLLALRRADEVAKGGDPRQRLDRLAALEQRADALLTAGAVLSLKELAIGGKDLMKALGLAPGPQIGQLLQALLEEVIEDPARNRPDYLLGRARELQR